MTILKFCLFIDPVDNAFLGHLDQRCVKQGPRAALHLSTLAMSTTIWKERHLKLWKFEQYLFYCHPYKNGM